jgi:GAF domain-containing protein
MKFDLNKLALRALERLAGWYLPACVVAVQLIAYLLGPSFLISQNNARFTTQQFGVGFGLSVALAILSLAVLGLWARSTTRDARLRLDDFFRTGRAAAGADVEARAWQQVNALTRQFVLISFIVSYLAQTLPVLAYLLLVHRITSSQVLYLLLGTFAAMLGGTVIAALLLEELLQPVRRLLTPSGFEEQLAGTAQFRLSTKLLGVAAALVLISMSVIAPIGYRHTLLAMSTHGGGQQALWSFQVQSILSAALILALGLVISYLVVRSLTRPIDNMVSAFQLIEKGDLSQRVALASGDEIGELAVYFNHMLARLADLQQSLERQVNERTAQLRATVEVARAAGAILDVDELAERVVNVISTEFGYYYVALFLNDPSGQWAELRAATGDAGRVLRLNKHRLAIGGKSMVGRAINASQAVVALDTASGQIRFDNPLLPYTRSEIALPLVVGDRVLGALDAQSTRESDFDPQDIDILSTMASQVATALENARLFQEAQQSLQDMRAIQRQYLLASWKDFAQEKGAISFEAGIADPSESLSRVNIPLSLRDQLIGEIDLTTEHAGGAQHDRSHCGAGRPGARKRPPGRGEPVRGPTGAPSGGDHRQGLGVHHRGRHPSDCGPGAGTRPGERRGHRGVESGMIP